MWLEMVILEKGPGSCMPGECSVLGGVWGVGKPLALPGAAFI